MKNIKSFLSENFHFLEVKFSIYLNTACFRNVVCKGDNVCNIFAFMRTCRTSAPTRTSQYRIISLVTDTISLLALDDLFQKRMLPPLQIFNTSNFFVSELNYQVSVCIFLDRM